MVLWKQPIMVSCRLVFVALLVLSTISFTQATNVTTPLKIITILEPPFVIQDATTGHFSGLLVDVLTEAGVSTDHMTVEKTAGPFGWEERPEVFDHVLEKVAQGKYDLAVAPFSIRSKRSKVVTFTQPILHAGYMVLYKTPKGWSPVFNEIATLVKPFSPLLWALLVLTCLVASIALYLVKRFSPYEDVTLAPPTTKGENHAAGRLSFGGGFLFLFGSLLGQSYNVAPRSISGRILTAAWWLFALMTVSAYVSSLVVILFKSNPDSKSLPFSRVSEMVRQKDVKVLGVKGSATYEYISNHTGFWEKKVYEMWKHRWDELMVDSVTEALKLLNEGNGEYAVFMDEASADYLANTEPCDKMVIGEPVGDQRFGLACPQGSKVCERLNHVILRLQEEGKMEKIRERWFWSGCHMSSEMFYDGHPYLDTNHGGFESLSSSLGIAPTTITIDRFGAGFLLILCGTVLAMVVLVAELIYAKRIGNFHHLLQSRDKNGNAHIIATDVIDREL